MDFNVISQSRNQLGEGLFASNDLGLIAWVDIITSKIFLYFTKRHVLQTYSYPHVISNIFFADKTKAIVLDDVGIAFFYWADNKIERVMQLPEVDRLEWRGNDGVMLSSNSFLFGIMHKKDPKNNCGSVWLYEDGVMKKIQNNHIPNSFIVKDRHVYITDSAVNDVFIYCIDSKKIISRWITYNKSEGDLDGGFLSENNFFYFALWGGAKIIKLDKTGKLVDHKKLPLIQPTNCKQLGSQIIITSALDELNLFNNQVKTSCDGNVISIGLF